MGERMRGAAPSAILCYKFLLLLPTMLVTVSTVSVLKVCQIKFPTSEQKDYKDYSKRITMHACYNRGLILLLQ